MKANKNYYDSVYLKYYDEISQERRDIKAITRDLANIIGKREKLLEIGVGTGLYIQELIGVHLRQYEIWGVDNSELLLDKAKVKFVNHHHVHLYLQDILDLDLDQEFDCVYSCGGVILYMMDSSSDDHFFASHILSRENNLIALKNISTHLRRSGLLVLSLADFKNFENKELEDGAIFFPRVERQIEEEQQYLVVDLSIKKNGKVIDQKVINLLLIDYGESLDMFFEAGFEFVNISPDGKYYIFSKK